MSYFRGENSFKSTYCVLKPNQSPCCANNRGCIASISLASAATDHALYAARLESKLSWLSVQDKLVKVV